MAKSTKSKAPIPLKTAAPATPTPAPPRKHAKTAATHIPFAKLYPAIAEWVECQGWIEIGQDENSDSMVRALDCGGMVWEGRSKYASIDALLLDLENGITEWIDKHG